MKKVYKSLIVLLTILMVSITIMPVFAEEKAPEVKITIKGSDDAHTYEAYQLFKGQYSGTGIEHKLSNIAWGDAVAEVLDVEIDTDSHKTVLNLLTEGFTGTYNITFEELGAEYKRGEGVNGGKILDSNDEPVYHEFNEKIYSLTDTEHTNPIQITRAPKTANELADQLRLLSEDSKIQAYTAKAFEAIDEAKKMQPTKVHFVKSVKDGIDHVFNLTDAVPFGSDNYATNHVLGKGEGYYLIKDRDSSLTNGTNHAYSRFMVRAAGVVEVEAKMSHPVVIKKVKENTDITLDKNKDDKIKSYTLKKNYNDIADVSSGELIPFEIVATVPSTIDGYKELKYEFVDTMAKGLVLYGEPVVKLIGNGQTYVLKDGYTRQSFTDIHEDNDATKPVIEKQGTITINNLKGEFHYGTDSNSYTLDAGSVKSDWFVVIEYNAKLTKDAVFGGTGNSNKVLLKYSNDPNGINEGSYGTTLPDEVRVYSYKLEITKQDAQATNNIHEKLAGAKFKLSRIINGNETWAVVNSDNLVTEWVSSVNNATELVTNADGFISVIGLDEGNYTLKETVAPTGFNLLTSPIEFSINESSLNPTQDMTTAPQSNVAITVKASLDIAAKTDATQNGAVAMLVNNKAGAKLPVTGGVGTTMFYVAGIALVSVATMMLISRKKESK